MRTIWTKGTDLALRIGVGVPVLSQWAWWRVLWGVTIHGAFYGHIRRPWYNGSYWTEQAI
jgi:hypothetical protein